MTEADTTMKAAAPPRNRLRSALELAWLEAFNAEMREAAPDEAAAAVFRRARMRLLREVGAMFPARRARA